MKTRPLPISPINTVVTGIYFGTLQWSAFFLLQSYLASTAIVYLLATAAWMAGSLAGLALPGKGRELAWLIASIACFGLLHLLATSHPYAMNWLPALLLCIAGMGGYAGRFFRFRAMAGSVENSDRLFLWENTGFISGMGLTLVLLTGLGDSTLLVAPAAGAVLCGITLLALPASPETLPLLPNAPTRPDSGKRRLSAARKGRVCPTMEPAGRGQP